VSQGLDSQWVRPFRAAEENGNIMETWFKRLAVGLNLVRDEYGQDLIEYALIVALIAFAATVGMNSVAAGINTAFSNIATKLSTVIT
jgi:pilus assembly protein Flp/PilA